MVGVLMWHQQTFNVDLKQHHQILKILKNEREVFLLKLSQQLDGQAGREDLCIVTVCKSKTKQF